MNLQQYSLRHAAGMNWVIRNDQQEAQYVPPFAVNACGALLWKGLEAGCGAAELAKMLQDQFEIEEKEAWDDVTGFLKQLSDMGIEAIIVGGV